MQLGRPALVFLTLVIGTLSVLLLRSSLGMFFFASSFVERGKGYYASRQYDKAIADYTEAIRIAPRYADAYFNRADAWRAKKDDDKALADYTRATRLNPQTPRTLYWNGYQRRIQKEYDKAIEEYTWSIRLDPRYADAFFGRAYAYIEMRQYDQAIADCTEAVRLETRAVFFSERAYAYRRKGQYDKALEDYDRSVGIDPGHARGLSGRAWLRATCPAAQYRNGAHALADATRACELSNYKDGDALSSLAAACAENGQFDRAVKLQTKALQDRAFAQQKGDARQRLELYQQKKPYREKPD
jgi:tetratricopeptide (TPR) repeat protein